MRIEAQGAWRRFVPDQNFGNGVIGIALGDADPSLKIGKTVKESKHRTNGILNPLRNVTLAGSLLFEAACGLGAPTPTPTPTPGEGGRGGVPTEAPSISPSISPAVSPTLEVRGGVPSPSATPTKTPEASVALGICPEGTVASAKGCVEIFAAPSASPGVTPTRAPAPTEVVGKAPTPAVAVPEGACPPTETSLRTTFEIAGTGIRMTGIPERVDRAKVDRAAVLNQSALGGNKDFLNAMGQGTEAFLADPGGLGVGPDFGYTGGNNPWGVNRAGWDAMYAAGGSIFPWLDEYLHAARECPPKFENNREGGFSYLIGVQMNVEVGRQNERSQWTSTGVKAELPEQDPHNNIYFFVIRGLYGDNQQNTDRNRTLRITNYVPGHTLFKGYPARRDSNTAFVSEEQFWQDLATAHAQGSNCGDGGCSKVTVVYLDLNSGANGVWEHTASRQEAIADWKNMKNGLKTVYRNY